MSSDNDDNKVFSSTPKKNKEVVKESNNEGLLHCKLCNYKCKKEKCLNKHIITNHEEHQCKECQEKLSTFMELLKHVANHHSKDEGEVQGEDDKQEEHIEKELNQKESGLEEVRIEKFMEKDL